MTPGTGELNDELISRGKKHRRIRIIKAKRKGMDAKICPA
jgi:hypothetical protein